MDDVKIKDELISSIKNVIKHIETKEYWGDINSFCLYTDESVMSVALLFNTFSFYNDMKDIEYPLTYKYKPSEWFSETIKESEDPFLCNNVAFSTINSYLRGSFSVSDFNNNKEMVIKACIEALHDCIENLFFKKDKHLVYMFMVSDCYDQKDIWNWNRALNVVEIQDEMKIWIENEL